MSQLDNTILGRIVQDTSELVQRRKDTHPLSSLESMSGFDRTPFSLADSLSGDALSLIAEAKKASPSQGVIRADFDPVAISRSYGSGGASAVSILTEPFHFQGDIQFLADCRPELSIPVLRKDFIVDPYQIVEARAYGADAILLIVACLDRELLKELQQTAAELGLSCLVELYDPNELDLVDLDCTEIIGVNSRDLRTFEVDLKTAVKRLRSLPDHIIRVAESGIKSQDDFQFVKDNGIHAALVGESFMRQADPGAALHNTLRALK